ncbi:MAG: hypothetical protein B7X92_10320 [Novosphingobium sp. 17-62-9]|nr:MAG: hypothetical protein B7X92_10320 [Novosphingobium sp. 17-62-9]
MRIHPGINESAATIRTLLAEREAAHAKGWNEAIEAGVKACGAEQLGDPQDEADAAYDRGVEHCVAAILALAKP